MALASPWQFPGGEAVGPTSRRPKPGSPPEIPGEGTAQTQELRPLRRVCSEIPPDLDRKGYRQVVLGLGRASPRPAGKIMLQYGGFTASVRTPETVASWKRPPLLCSLLQRVERDLGGLMDVVQNVLPRRLCEDPNPRTSGKDPRGLVLPLPTQERRPLGDRTFGDD